MVTQPYLWRNHAQQVTGEKMTGYQLQKYLLIDVKPISNETKICPITKFEVEQDTLTPGITWDGDRYIKLDKDLVTEDITFDLKVWVGTQVIQLPYVTVAPRKDPFPLSIFLIISILLLLLVILLCVCLCCMCCRIKKMSADAELNGGIQMNGGVNA